MSTKELEKVKLKEQVIRLRELILHNDDFNTFDHVITCLMSICDHAAVQAEQCAYIVHHNGKCSVKAGTSEKLQPMLIALQLQNLTAEIK
ncbi:ATP-dependent Clp protease adaptor ClpS [Vicingaceae bacterium]|nr:ATP-dependent Clp protease adaptor ClpS [Vicingaceae bacterium]MDC1452614.1 ATP-dependent Clp protease adaptor ClpS [Vicingaceae bacterium]